MKAFFLFLMFFSANAFASFPFGGQSFKTPNDHYICDGRVLINPEKNAPAIEGFEQEMPNIKKFYFYKDYVVGYSDSLYFIFNEKSEVMEVFDGKGEWESKIEFYGVNPWITRWLSVDDSPQFALFLLTIGFLVTIPLAIVFLFFWIGSFWMAISKEKFSLRKGINTKVFLGLSLVLMWGWSELFWLESI